MITMYITEISICCVIDIHSLTYIVLISLLNNGNVYLLLKVIIVREIFQDTISLIIMIRAEYLQSTKSL